MALDLQTGIDDAELRTLFEDAATKQKQNGGVAGAEWLFNADGLHPQRWGVAKKQLEAFKEEVSKAMSLGDIKNQPDPAKDFYYEPAKFTSQSIGPNVHQVNNGLIKPRTANHHTFPGVSWAVGENHKKGGLLCKLFISHAWNEGVFEFIHNALAEWPEDCEGAYICFLSNPQMREPVDLVELALNNRDGKSPFELVLCSNPRPQVMLIVANSNDAIHGRLWCVLEAYLADEERKRGTSLHVRMAGKPLHLITGENRKLMERKQAVLDITPPRMSRPRSSTDTSTLADQLTSIQEMEEAISAITQIKLDTLAKQDSELVDLCNAGCSTKQDEERIRLQIKGREPDVQYLVADLIRDCLCDLTTARELPCGPLNLSLHDDTVDLSGKDLSRPKNLINLAAWLQIKPANLRHLKLRGCNLTDQALTLLKRSTRALPQLKTLDLCDNPRAAMPANGGWPGAIKVLTHTTTGDEGPCLLHLAIQPPAHITGHSIDRAAFIQHQTGLEDMLRDNEKAWNKGHCVVGLSDAASPELAGIVKNGRLHTLLWAATGHGWELERNPAGTSLNELVKAMRLHVSDVALLHEQRDAMLEGRFEVELARCLQQQPRLPGKDNVGPIQMQIDRTQFAEQYEQSVRSLKDLTPHQRAKLAECRGKHRLHIFAPAGAGKTYLAMAEMQSALNDAGRDCVLFVAPKAPLSYFVVRWLCEREPNATRQARIIERLHVLFEPLCDGPRTFIVNAGRIEFLPRERSVRYGLVVVDEAHHLYKDANARNEIANHVTDSFSSGCTGGNSRLLVLSDVSQSTGRESEIKFPAGLTPVVLSEVVRCSRRIVQAASSFQIGGQAKLNTQCHHGSDGPPLKSYLFDVEEEAMRFSKYAEQTVDALHDVINTFPGLNLQGRLAILVPDDAFLLALEPELLGVLKKSTFGSQYGLIRASEASAMLFQQSMRSKKDTEALVLDTVTNFDGLERLIVFAVGLDAVIDMEGGHVKVLETRSMLYRAITRSHMITAVINEAIRGGWFEFLSGVKLVMDSRFDREAEQRRINSDDADTVVALLELIDRAMNKITEQGAAGGMGEAEHKYLQGRVLKQARSGDSTVTDAVVLQTAERVVKTYQREKAALSTAISAHGRPAVSSDGMVKLHSKLDSMAAESAASGTEGLAVMADAVVKSDQLVCQAIEVEPSLDADEKSTLQMTILKHNAVHADSGSATAAVQAASQEWADRKAQKQSALEAAVLNSKLQEAAHQAVHAAGVALSSSALEIVVREVLKTLLNEQPQDMRLAVEGVLKHCGLAEEEVLRTVVDKEPMRDTAIVQSVWDTSANQMSMRDGQGFAFNPFSCSPEVPRLTETKPAEEEPAESKPVEGGAYDGGDAKPAEEKPAEAPMQHVTSGGISGAYAATAPSTMYAAPHQPIMTHAAPQQPGMTSAAPQQPTITYEALHPRVVTALQLLLDSTATDLQLGYLGLGDADAQALGDALSTNQSVTILRLSGNKIGDKGAQALASALHINKSLAMLDLAGNEIGADGAQALAAALHHNNTLKQLGLLGNEIGDDGAKALAAALHQNSNLEYLNLSRNKIGDAGAQALAAALHQNSNLERLYLFSNRIGDAGAQALANALCTNRSLQKLDLEFNPIGEAGKQALRLHCGRVEV
eukprot:NODE_3_length_5113_cov_5.809667.p1 GENE.NODE_3_length_5113_cov_5.809667~~NODE_3_length_5113_cov_5.809667.p1  ORF type:complete len:1644 (-),score=416.18 NODE_3_length_5113_cov_5.809667:89-5020(-)